MHEQPKIGNREVKEMICSCGGRWKEVVLKKREIKHGCQRDKDHVGDFGCCVTAFQCNKCKTRITVALHAPEMLD